ncbi:phosphoribosylglycinamide formyltransferase [Mollicutes bacterium LVI A0039]|nr:phosphoribosylglycinamide formyltransferase [Mollicutes bacterium LVI A0039]
MRIAAFASGNGSNISQLVLNGVAIELIICNNPNAYIIERAKQMNIKCIVIPTKNQEQETYERLMLEALQLHNIELVVLAGYMKLIGATLLDEYQDRIINIHPSLLPSFKGAHAIADAFNFGVRVSGVTVHYIDSELDSGTIIMQKPVAICDDDTLETFEMRIHEAEYEIFHLAVKKVIKELNEKSIGKC